MMTSDEESNEGNRTDSPTHACPIEETEGTVVLQYVTDHCEHREYENIHLGMSEESEQMLVQDSIPTASNVKELCIKVPI